MPPPNKDRALEVHGMFFCYDGEEFWLWSEAEDVWTVLPMKPSYLKVENGQLALIDDIFSGKKKCTCATFQVVNFGRKCGGT